MANKNYSHIHSLTTSTNNINHLHSVITPLPISSVLTTTTTTLPTLQIASISRPTEIYSENNNRSNSVITHSSINKLLRDTIKQEFKERPVLILPDSYTLTNSKIRSITTPEQTVIAAIRLNPRDATNGLSMTMTNTSGHHMSTMNQAHMQDGADSYFVSGITGDLTSAYKLPQSSNSNLPSPSSSSNSSNPPSSSHHHHHHHHHNQTKRHGESGNPTQKREMRLQKNREAARECRRKKKEYIKCLEERVTGLENQNKALIEELRQLKELYCQREETNGVGNNNNNINNKTSTSTR